LFPVFDGVMGGVVPEPTINAMKTFATNRVAFVKSQIPLNIRVITNTLPVVNGYLTTTNSAILLNGFANVVETRSVRVGGNVATWNPVGGAWSNVVNLLPGFNRVLVQTFNARVRSSNELSSTSFITTGALASFRRRSRAT
jgi:hypothetical protein